METNPRSANNEKPWLFVTYITTLAGIVYCSWPLGYWLNPAVSRRGLASALEGLHQPYNWVFIGLDVISGILVVISSLYIWEKWGKPRRTWLDTVLVNFSLFGIFTAIDAALPLSCDPSVSKCPNNLLHNPLLIAHGFFSIAASVCLFISVAIVWWLRRRNGGSKIMAGLIIGWTIFGILSLLYYFIPGPGYLTQHYYITLCSVWTALLPFAVWDLMIFRKEISAANLIR